MGRLLSVKHLGVLGVLLSGSTASADVTAQQVWDKWTEHMAVYGQGFTTGGETTSGNTMIVSDVNITMADDDAKVTANIGDITLTENGDGSVNIAIQESYPITMDITPDFGEPSTINLIVEQTGMVLNVSGEPDAMIYDITADRYAMHVDSLTGDAAKEVILEDVSVDLLDLSARYSILEDDLTQVSVQFDLGALDIDLHMVEPNGDDVVSGNIDLGDIAMFANIDLPLDFDNTADQPPFDDGLAVDAGYSYGNLAAVFDINADGEAASGAISAERGQFEFSLDYDGLNYAENTRGIDISVLVPNELPFPIEVAMVGYGYDFQIPLSQGDGEPRDARIAFNLTDLAISNGIWNLLDPSEILPRDPFTVALGLDAQVTSFFDFLDPDQQESLQLTNVPGELHGVQLTDLTVRGAGAEITGAGAFTFDNSDLETFDGLPRPEGQADFAINGANGLVDKLIQMGLIPADQALMPRMMMGMFATPIGDDMLTSTIEVNSEGHVLANGQRLR